MIACSIDTYNLILNIAALIVLLLIVGMLIKLYCRELRGDK